MKISIVEDLKSNVEKVWDLVTDNENYQWRSDLESIRLIDENNFIEKDKNGYEVSFQIVRKIQYKEYEFTMTSSNTSGSWLGKFEELPNGGSRIEFTEDISTNNIIMKLFLKKFIKNHQAKYIADLKKALAE